MFYIIGLGNPGEQYMDTPHNVGWAIIDQIQKKNIHDFGDFEMDGFRHALVCGGELEGETVELLKPQTFMLDQKKKRGLLSYMMI